MLAPRERTVTYAAHRRIIDADSHVIELDDFLSSFADPADRALIPPMDAQTELPVVPEGLARGRELFARRQSDPETMAKFETHLLDAHRSGWNRIGAFDPQERSHCLDLLGFELQLILPTFSFHQIAHCKEPRVLEAGARTLNRAMGAFCAHDPRLRAIGYIPLSLGPEIAIALMDRGFLEGCYTFMVDTNEPDASARSFTHPDFDPVWARFQDAGVPFVVHIAVNGHYQAISPSFLNNGHRSAPSSADAPSGALGLLTLKNSAELFLSAMIFDGVFERFPGLKGISMEHGCVWLPSWLRAIDTAAHSLRKLQPQLADRELRPSEVVRRSLRFAPFAGEPLGWVIENVGPELLVFGSDYPHPEGTSNPIERFEATLTNCDQATLDAFYYGNMESVMGEAIVSDSASGG
ncbi:MAG: amidohydrolase family protein [Myxococcales bacterium]|nr:amidohydrolase family protein [Myxococcales bacterium]